MVNLTRVEQLNQQAVRSRSFVLYWMQASQRTQFNHALEYSILKANKLNKPLLVYFGLTSSYPEANERHYYFMLEGLKEVKNSLEEKGIKFMIKQTSPETGAVELSKDASLVVVDKGYTKIEKSWRNYVAEHARCPVVEVESNVIVPVAVASPKEEYSAATFRPKIKKVLDNYLKPVENNVLQKPSLELALDSFDVDNIPKTVSQLGVDKTVKKSPLFQGGFTQANRLLEVFIKTKLDDYAELRNDPTKQCTSDLSPYLHFGQISPLHVALNVLVTDAAGKDSFLEELVVRRELAFNFVYYNRNYDSFNCLPEWCKKTLTEHSSDQRPYLYSLDELENAQTHDPYWNAAQKQMVLTGKMHGYMRMYWGKKIIEWTKTPQHAYKVALILNNKYELDGRDPNGFTGVAWCFGKHDRPWKERVVFGKIRYMNAKGLQRKFDAYGYLKMVEGLVLGNP